MFHVKHIAFLIVKYKEINIIPLMSIPPRENALQNDSSLNIMEYLLHVVYDI